MARKPADKQRRQQRIAIGGAVLLAVVLVIQVPRTLKMLKPDAGAPTASAESSSSSAAPAPAPAAPVVRLAETEQAPKPLPRGGDFGRKDPFARRPAESTGSADAGRKGEPGFRLVAGSARVADSVPSRRGAYVVVLRSLPVDGGRGAALRAAAAFRARGLTGAGVLVSSKYGSLNKGYYVVHAGRFASRLAALEALLRARRVGAQDPYVRPLQA
jgi:hypothetical protein